MKRMEDIFKDRLEAYEETLPETGLADFLTRLDESRTSAVRKRHRSVWSLATPAVAASLLAVFVLTRPQADHDIMADQEQVAVIEKSVTEDLLAQADFVNPKNSQADANASLKKKEQVAVNEPTGSDSTVDNTAEEPTSEAASSLVDPDSVFEDASNSRQDSSASIGSPAIFDPTDLHPNGEYSDNQIYIKIFPTAAGALGATYMGLSSIGRLFTKDYSADIESLLPPSDAPAYTDQPGQQYPSYGGIGSGLKILKEKMPLTIGASLRWNFADRLSLTTGLDYSRYKALFSIKYWTDGMIERTVTDNYVRRTVGIPVRIDYSFVQTRWLDLYLGAGGLAEYGVSSELIGMKANESGFSFSAQAASGLQINLTKHIGAYIEPQLIWDIPSVLKDDRFSIPEKPVFFKLATGIRFTI